MSECSELFTNILSIEMLTPVSIIGATEDINSLMVNKYLQESESILSFVSVFSEQVGHVHGNLTAYSDKEIAAIDKKLNICIKLLTMLFNEQERANPQVINISARGLAWNSDHIYQEGQGLLLQIYPSLEFPKPIVVSVEVIAQQQHGSQHHICAKFVAMPQSLSEALEKFIFLQHRRQVSLHKHV